MAAKKKKPTSRMSGKIKKISDKAMDKKLGIKTYKGRKALKKKSPAKSLKKKGRKTGGRRSP